LTKNLKRNLKISKCKRFSTNRGSTMNSRKQNLRKRTCLNFRWKNVKLRSLIVPRKCETWSTKIGVGFNCSQSCFKKARIWTLTTRTNSKEWLVPGTLTRSFKTCNTSKRWWDAKKTKWSSKCCLLTSNDSSLRTSIPWLSNHFFRTFTSVFYRKSTVTIRRRKTFCTTRASLRNLATKGPVSRWSRTLCRA
jgi:hypothetical protein